MEVFLQFGKYHGRESRAADLYNGRGILHLIVERHSDPASQDHTGRQPGKEVGRDVVVTGGPVAVTEFSRHGKAVVEVLADQRRHLEAVAPVSQRN